MFLGEVDCRGEKGLLLSVSRGNQHPQEGVIRIKIYSLRAGADNNADIHQARRQDSSCRWARPIVGGP